MDFAARPYRHHCTNTESHCFHWAALKEKELIALDVNDGGSGNLAFLSLEQVCLYPNSFIGAMPPVVPMLT